MDDTSARRFAAIGDDGMRPVVWGLGDSQFAAENEARYYAREAGCTTGALRIVEVDEATWERVRGGDVSAEGL